MERSCLDNLMIKRFYKNVDIEMIENYMKENLCYESINEFTTNIEYQIKCNQFKCSLLPILKILFESNVDKPHELIKRMEKVYFKLLKKQEYL